MAIGGGVTHSTASMLTYHSGALDGSAAYAATRSRGRSIMISVRTSTATSSPLPRLAGAGLQVRLEAAEEVLPALRHHLGGRVLPAVVVQRDQHGATRVGDS